MIFEPPVRVGKQVRLESEPTSADDRRHTMTGLSAIQTIRSATSRTHSSISDSTQTVHFGPSDRDLGNLPSLIRW